MALTLRRRPVSSLDHAALEQEDTRFSYGETRFAVDGMTDDASALVIYTPRGEQLRLIAGTKANRRRTCRI